MKETSCLKQSWPQKDNDLLN